MESQSEISQQFQTLSPLLASASAPDHSRNGPAELTSTDTASSPQRLHAQSSPRSHCIMCQKLCDASVTLPCHAVCQLCLGMLIHYRDPADIIQCPECNNLWPLNDLWREHYCTRIFPRNDEPQRHGSPVIESCHRCKQFKVKDASHAEHFCYQCHQHLCGPCSRTLHARGRLPHHIVIPLVPGDLTLLQQRGVSYCYHHPEMSLTIVCVTCNVSFCQKCQETEHEGHRLWDVGHNLQNARNTLMNRLEAMQDHKKLLQRLLSLLQFKHHACQPQLSTVDNSHYGGHSSPEKGPDMTFQPLSTNKMDTSQCTQQFPSVMESTRARHNATPRTDLEHVSSDVYPTDPRTQTPNDPKPRQRKKREAFPLRLDLSLPGCSSSTEASHQITKMTDSLTANHSVASYDAKLSSPHHKGSECPTAGRVSSSVSLSSNSYAMSCISLAENSDLPMSQEKSINKTKQKFDFCSSEVLPAEIAITGQAGVTGKCAKKDVNEIIDKLAKNSTAIELKAKQNIQPVTTPTGGVPHAAAVSDENNCCDVPVSFHERSGADGYNDLNSLTVKTQYVFPTEDLPEFINKVTKKRTGNGKTFRLSRNSMSDDFFIHLVALGTVYDVLDNRLHRLYYDLYYYQDQCITSLSTWMNARLLMSDNIYRILLEKFPENPIAVPKGNSGSWNCQQDSVPSTAETRHRSFFNSDLFEQSSDIDAERNGTVTTENRAPMEASESYEPSDLAIMEDTERALEENVDRVIDTFYARRRSLESPVEDLEAITTYDPNRMNFTFNTNVEGPGSNSNAGESATDSSKVKQSYFSSFTSNEYDYSLVGFNTVDVSDNSNDVSSFSLTGINSTYPRISVESGNVSTISENISQESNTYHIHGHSSSTGANAISSDRYENNRSHSYEMYKSDMHSSSFFRGQNSACGSQRNFTNLQRNGPDVYGATPGYYPDFTSTDFVSSLNESPDIYVLAGYKQGPSVVGTRHDLRVN